MAERLDNASFEEIRELAVQAQHDGRYADGIQMFAEAILIEGGVVLPANHETYRLPQAFGRKTGYVTERAEVAIPKEVFGWDVQRVRVDRLEVGRKERRPGFSITEAFHLGSVGTTIVEYDGKRTMKIKPDRWAIATVHRDVGSEQDVCSVMNLASHSGVISTSEPPWQKKPARALTNSWRLCRLLRSRAGDS
jgi:hypothetical protein